ncbi:hypothetical protein [Caproicibacterium lactatifermentans]|jgi:hypothetical protein|uniref:Uncharacterized protein n=1 Tax=Caproicibacterium lactatifermentans TaxID=2666138 RepID=A0A859DTA8_9FIRM|nr:hypothetical protein [Caproicibacterium lactatifermentans]ARP51022.1 hypothetical protein B6259_09155 [Ruminococcaceae bacterium CPB6]MDD4807160.1 hypothetical protein [Oscillospiraceae bacterium]QKN23251.1 hypothetical protein GJQ69_01350 [Caproicibacterium lactatifermentans]QKO30067.1 hypothetical protein GKP14_03000 [Caproicibacterium lactatifermentans]
MKTAVLFCGARRTAYCQELLENSGFLLTQVRTAQEAGQPACLGQLLKQNRMVCAVGPSHSGRPSFGQPLFQALGVPLLDDSPQGVLVLQGNECSGWLVESREQAVALLPDKPEYLMQLLPQLWLRLRRKFHLQQAVNHAFSGKEQP